MKTSRPGGNRKANFMTRVTEEQVIEDEMGGTFSMNCEVRN
jgi:hypothetical protein